MSPALECAGYRTKNAECRRHGADVPDPAQRAIRGQAGQSSCVAEKLSWATKNEDFLVPEFDFQAFSNADGQVLDLYLSR
jgi:hypothetical protein